MPITQRVIDAAALLLTTAATRTEQTGCTTTAAFTYGENRAAETYNLDRTELAHAARLSTFAAFAMGAYSIRAMTNPTERATALRTAIPHLSTDQRKDQPCSPRSEPCSPEPPSRSIPPNTSTPSARHSMNSVSAWRRFVNFLSGTSTVSTANPPADNPITTSA